MFTNKEDSYKPISSPTNLSKNFTLLLGSFTYFALLVLAIVYYKERVIFSDVSFILFQLILEGDWAIQVNRFVSFFTQSFGLFASKVGLPLNWVAMIHSAGFVIYYYAAFLIILKALKNKSIATGLVLFNVLMVTLSFYWIPSELIQGMAFVFIYIAIIENLLAQEKQSYLLHLFSFICLVTSIFAHPLIIFALSFSVLYLILHEKKKYLFLGIHLILIVAVYLFKTKVMPNKYDSEAMQGLDQVYQFLTSFDTSSFHDFFQYLASDYIFLSLGTLVVLSYFLFTKQLLKALLFIGFFVGYSIVVNVAQADLRLQYYIESQYLILSLYIILPIVKEILPKLTKKWLIGSLAFIVIISLIRIQQAHRPFTEKLDWQRTYLAETKDYENKKIVRTQDELPMDILLEHWGSGYEFWLLSTIETGVTRSIVITKNEDEIDWLINKQDKQLFIAKWDKVPYHKLNPRYFILTDTSHYYKKISSE